MAIKYVYSGAAGANDGTSWTDAWTSIASAAGAGSTAGDKVYIASDHSQNPGASASYTFSGATLTNPIWLISVDRSDDSYLPAASAQFSGAASDFTLIGNMRVYGLYIDVADDLAFSFSGDQIMRFYDCTLSHADAFNIAFPSSNNSGRCEFDGCTINKSAAGSEPIVISAGESPSHLAFDDCSFTGQGTVTLLNAMQNAEVVIEDSDVSVYETLVAADGQSTVVFKKCSVHATRTLFSGTILPTGRYVLHACDDGTITVPPLGLTESRTYYGVVKSSLSRYRTGGADDGFQANEHSWEMAANANALEIVSPLRSPPLVRSVAADGSISGATARGIRTSTRCGPLSTPAALTTDGTSTWNGADVGTKQKVSVTLTNAETLTVYVASGGTLNNDDFWIEVSEPDQVGGPCVVRACLAKPSTTVYVDPYYDVA